ncbi:MAG: hypothetical protein M0Q94_11440, partial [Candidatus Cloacimonetes bacterium]|nr:hypothetical protein [Candidatus Cloacimonadota bacterium]
ELGRDYLLEPEVLTTYFKIDCENVSNDNLNYFSIITLLHYIKNNNRYNELRIYLKEIILNKYFRDRSWYNKSCEHTMLFFDLISCPYLEYEFKKELFGKYDIKDDNLCKKTISFQRNWFTKWQNFNAIEEILRKKSKEVY